ncbi:hypothetical protein EsH8_I_001545 [Colletotrichum jinshuiense]
MAVLCLPIPVAMTLRMSWARRFRVVVMLSAGGLATAASIIRLVLVVRLQESNDEPVDFIRFNLLGTDRAPSTAEPLQVPDPNPTNFELEARRYVLDGSDGMPLEVREYHLINMEGLASRRLRTSLPENDHVAIIVYTADQPKVDPLESWRDGSMFNSSLDPEDGQKDFISFAQYQSGRGLQTTDVDLEAAPDVEERTGMTNRVAHLLRSWFTPRRVLSGFRNFLSFAVVFLLVEYLAGILFSR